MDAVVYVVDDDAGVRRSMGLLLDTMGYEVQCHASAEAFLDAYCPQRCGCLILDLGMAEGMNGLELHEELIRRGATLPVIYLTAYANVPFAVQAMKAGALDVFTKPLRPDALLDRIGQALKLDQQRRDIETEPAPPEGSLSLLTPREHEVLEQVLSGRSNKEIGRLLGISFRTVELHRSHILRKSGKSNMLEVAKTFMTEVPADLSHMLS